MTQRWNIDPAHSAVQFAVRHMVISKVRGGFSTFNGTIAFDPSAPTEGKASARIDAASIDTHEPRRDAHLRSADFLDADTHPALVFESNGVESLGRDRFRVPGQLTIRGVTQPVVLDVDYLGGGTDPWGGRRIGFHARTTIQRKAFGLNWNQVLEAGGVLVGDDVEITLDVQAVKES